MTFVGVKWSSSDGVCWVGKEIVNAYEQGISGSVLYLSKRDNARHI